MLFGRFEQGGGILVCYGGEGALARGGEGDAAFELVSERGGEVRAQQGFGRALQRLGLAALAAEAEAVHDAERGQQAHSPAGKALSRGQRPGQGQFKDEVGAAAGGGLGACKLRPHRRLAALDKVAGHGADYGCVTAECLAGALDEQRVAVVEGVEFCDYACGAHSVISFFGCWLVDLFLRLEELAVLLAVGFTLVLPVPPHFFGLAQRNGVEPQRKTLFGVVAPP